MDWTLVVPLDGSELAERALPLAIRMAQARQGRLVLVRAAHVPPALAAEGQNWETSRAWVMEDAEQYITAVAQRISSEVAVETATCYGQPVDQIIESVETFHADGIVMATHGRSGLAHLVLGSVTEGVLGRTNVPVYVVPSRPGQAAVEASAGTVRVLVAQDGSDNDETALQTAADLVGEQGELILVAVAAPPDHVFVDQTGRHVLAYLDQQEEARTRELRVYLMRQAELLRVGGKPVRVELDVRLGDPVEGIMAAADEHHPDLIVMATHGRTGIRRAVVGSIAGEVLRTARIPVVLVHPKQAPPAASATEEPVGASNVGPIPTF